MQLDISASCLPFITRKMHESGISWHSACCKVQHFKEGLNQQFVCPSYLIRMFYEIVDFERQVEWFLLISLDLTYCGALLVHTDLYSLMWGTQPKRPSGWDSNKCFLPLFEVLNIVYPLLKVSFIRSAVMLQQLQCLIKIFQMINVVWQGICRDRS